MEDDGKGVKESPEYILGLNIHCPSNLFHNNGTELSAVGETNNNLSRGTVFRDPEDRPLKHVFS
jgi:hypothetical protein